MAAIDLLIDRQRRFVLEYFRTGDSIASYRAAGYKATNEASSHSAAHRLLVNVQVQAALAELRATQQQRVEVAADRVLSEVDILATSSMGDIFDFSGASPVLRPAHTIPDHAIRSIKSLKVVTATAPDGTVVNRVELSLWDKNVAQKTSLQRRGLLQEKVSIEVILGALPADFAGRVRQLLVERLRSESAGHDAGYPGPNGHARGPTQLPG